MSAGRYCPPVFGATEDTPLAQVARRFRCKTCHAERPRFAPPAGRRRRPSPSLPYPSGVRSIIVSVGCWRCRRRLAWRCVTSLLARPVDSFWSPAPAGGNNARRRFIIGGEQAASRPPNELGLVSYTPLASSRPRVAHAPRRPVRQLEIESTREERSRRRLGALGAALLPRRRLWAATPKA